MVATYSELLKREFGSRLGATGDEYIGYTDQGALRMEQLLEDLRAYTLASARARSPAGDVDSGGSPGQGACQSGGGHQGERRLHYASPICPVSACMISSWSSSSRIWWATRSGIEAASRRESISRPSGRGKDWLFSVRDNGIGIDPQYKEQIFELFKRLHSVAEYPGTGMGLAICKRIVERGGGELWVDSEPGSGSTFFFTVPRRDT